MMQYLSIINDVLYGPYSVEKPTRTGIKTLSLSGVQFEHDMRDGFPLLTTKQMGIKSIAAELEFFIKGLSDKKWLQERKCYIWDEWANPKQVNEQMLKYKNNFSSYEGPHQSIIQGMANMDDSQLRIILQEEISDLGRIYGVQWRDWKTTEEYTPDGWMDDEFKFKTFDQLTDVIERAKKDPLDRRLLVTAWRPDEIDEMALPPCHYAWQILSDGYYLDLIWVQRSVDVGLGLPYNIASYALLLTLLSKELNLKPRRLIGHLADTHIYENHIDKLTEQLSRPIYELPKIEILNFKSIFDWEYTDVKLINYKCNPKIELEVAI